jgi:endonuclease/exonuclease/phosphatase family metal-dependent hydrolase
MHTTLFILALLLLSPLAAPAAEGELRVMSFNIRNGRARDGDDSWPLRRERLLSLLREEAADVIGLQEALRDQVDAIRRALPQYGEAGVGRDDGKAAGEHCTILYRSERFRLEEQGTFWFSDTPAAPGSMSWGNRITRICTWARLRETASGRTFTVFNLHLDHESQPSRERSIALLIERLRAVSGPRIVLGDFNAGEENPATRALLSVPALPLEDTFRVRHPKEKAVATFHGFEGGAEGDKIDYVIVTRAFAATDARIVRTKRDGRYPSDHYPVTARLRWKATQNESMPGAGWIR